MATLNLLSGVFILIALCSFCIAIPNRPLTSSDYENMILIRGKWFNKNGTSGISVNQQTSPQIFKQCFDHFSPSGCETIWDQRYWVRDDYYQVGGPIFFQFAGEGPGDGIIDTFFWHNYAQNYGAKLIVLENRFYGESWPSNNTDLETLKLLTARQTLADAAQFIETYSADNDLNNASWVAFGGSYAGNLAAWMKREYPSHVDFVVASSPPLEAQYRFTGYVETVSEVVKALDTDCYDKVFAAFQCMEGLVNGTGCEGYTNVTEILPALHQCNNVDFTNQLDRESFFNSLVMGKWAVNWPTLLIPDNCNALNSVNGNNPLEVYGEFLLQIGQGECKSTKEKDEEILEFIKTEEGRRAGAAGWFWQTCYELGYFQSSDPKNGLFGYETFSALPYSSQCLSEYGALFTPEYIESRIAETNDFYQGKNLDVNCVIFINGQWDPWHTLSINDPSETSENNTVISIPRAQHCADMLDPETDDVRLGQEKIMQQIGIYLNDPSCRTV